MSESDDSAEAVVVAVRETAGEPLKELSGVSVLEAEGGGVLVDEIDPSQPGRWGLKL